MNLTDGIGIIGYIYVYICIYSNSNSNIKQQQHHSDSDNSNKHFSAFATPWSNNGTENTSYMRHASV